MFPKFSPGRFSISPNKAGMELRDLLQNNSTYCYIQSLLHNRSSHALFYAVVLKGVAPIDVDPKKAIPIEVSRSVVAGTAPSYRPIETKALIKQELPKLCMCQ